MSMDDQDLDGLLSQAKTNWHSQYSEAELMTAARLQKKHLQRQRRIARGVGAGLGILLVSLVFFPLGNGIAPENSEEQNLVQSVDQEELWIPVEDIADMSMIPVPTDHWTDYL